MHTSRGKMSAFCREKQRNETAGSTILEKMLRSLRADPFWTQYTADEDDRHTTLFFAIRAKHSTPTEISDHFQGMTIIPLSVRIGIWEAFSAAMNTKRGAETGNLKALRRWTLGGQHSSRGKIATWKFPLFDSSTFDQACCLAYILSWSWSWHSLLVIVGASLKKGPRGLKTISFGLDVQLVRMSSPF